MCLAIVNCINMVLMNEESRRLIPRKGEVWVCIKHQAFAVQVAYLRMLFLSCQARASTKFDIEDDR